MHILLAEDEIAYLDGNSCTLAIAKTNGNSFYLETEKEEIVLFTDPEDLMVASSFSCGEKIRIGLRCTLFQLRELHAPLIVLPKGHPASPRLQIVVSIGQKTRLSCKIQPGTHPEQDVLCSVEEVSGLEVLAEPGGANLLGFSEKMGRIITEKILW